MPVLAGLWVLDAVSGLGETALSDRSPNPTAKPNPKTRDPAQPPHPPTNPHRDVAPLTSQRLPNCRIFLAQSPQRDSPNAQSHRLIDQNAEQLRVRHPKLPHAGLERVERYR